MTGKTLREQLPAGDPRNKVEFLADQLQLGLEELAKLKAKLGEPVINLINNGKFESQNGSTRSFAVVNAPCKIHPNINENGFCEAVSSAAIMPEGWGGEAVGSDATNDGLFGTRIQYIAPGIDVKNAQPVVVMNGVNYKAVIFAPFKAQREQVGDIELGIYRSHYVTVGATVRKGSNCRWGVVEVSPSTGEIIGVVFCEKYPYSAENIDLRKDGLLLSEQSQYALAFFEEGGWAAEGLTVCSAAAFFNDKKDPELMPSVWPVPPLNEFHVLKRGITKAQIRAGIDLQIGHLTGSTSKQSNHVALRVCYFDSRGNLTGDRWPVTEINKGNGVINIASKPLEELEFAICAKVTAYPQRIGFFKQLNSTHAFETLVEYPPK